MSPIFLAVLTIFVIGIVSFLIGWWLTTTRWKGQYFQEAQKRKTFERKNLRMESSLKKTEEAERAQRNRVQLLTADVQRLEKEVKNYRKEKRRQQLTVEETNNSPVVKNAHNALMNELNKEKKKNVELKKQIEKLRRLIRPNSNREEKVNHPNLEATINKNFIKRETNSSKETTYSTSISKESISQSHLQSILERIAIFSNENHQDDLSLIQGIDSKVAEQLNHKGFHSFKQMAMLTTRDFRILCDILNLPKEQANQEDWSAQANQLYYKKYG